jgi:hypothetical protein
VLYSLGTPRIGRMHATPIRRNTPARGERGVIASLLLGHWRGEHGLLVASLLPCVILLALWGLFTVIFDSVDWVWHYQFAAATSFVIVVLLLIAACWGAIGVGRSAKRADDMGEGLFRVYGAAGLVMACAIGTVGQFGFSTRGWLAYFSTLAVNQGPQAQVSVDASRSKMTIKGEFDFGTTQRVRAELLASPTVRLVEFESPGGVAIEGIALAELLEAKGVDTLVLKSCSSACVTAFAGGERRFLGPKGRLGLHSAGGGFRRGGRDADLEHERILQRRGVAKWLIEAESATPYSDILMPGPNTLLASGLVTGMWDGGHNLTEWSNGK